MMRFSLRVLILVGALLCVSVGVYAQSLLESSATRRISDQTGIPIQFVRTLFVDDDQGQFILAFIHINETSVNGDLNPDIKAAMAQYVNRNALLVMVVPARRSFFDPFSISLVQNVFRISVEPEMIRPITDDFTTGSLPSGGVSAGIIVLDTRVLVNQPFQVQYATSYSTTFDFSEAGEDSQTQGSFLQGGIGGFLNGGFGFLLLNLLFLFLFPFLLI